MASITIKNLPPELHQKLKAVAEHEGRSLNQEIVQRLRASLMKSRRDDEAATLGEGYRQLLAQGFWTTPEEIEALIQEGRKR